MTFSVQASSDQTGNFIKYTGGTVEVKINEDGKLQSRFVEINYQLDDGKPVALHDQFLRAFVRE